MNSEDRSAKVRRNLIAISEGRTFMKRCSFCTHTKPSYDFSKGRYSKDARKNTCKECDRFSLMRNKYSTTEYADHYIRCLLRRDKLSTGAKQMLQMWTNTRDRILARQRNG